jgi:AsmA protein
VANAALQSGAIEYLDRATGTKTEISGIEVVLKDLAFTAFPGVPTAKGIRFSGTLRAKELKTAEAGARDLEAKVAASGGIFDIRPFRLTLFGGKGEGGVRADLSKGEPILRIDYTLAGFRAEESLKAVAGKRALSGPLTLALDLACRGSDAQRLKRTLNGTASLRGNGLTFHGMDVDGALSTVAAAQGLNLADVGAFLLAAPLGKTATKGYRFVGIRGDAGRAKDTAVTKLVSDWTVHDGVARARDVAFSTGKNRIALQGRLDMPNERFAGVTVAVLDPAGCARIRQKIDGPFRAPRMDKAGALQSAVVGTVLDLLSPARKLIGTPACEKFYSGSVPHPG